MEEEDKVEYKTLDSEEGKVKKMMEVNLDSTHLLVIFSVKWFHLPHRPYYSNHKHYLSYNYHFLRGYQKNDKEKVLSNPNLLQVKDSMVPKGKCVDCQVLEITMERDSGDIETLKTKFTTLDEIFDILTRFVVKAMHATSTMLQLLQQDKED